MRHFIAIAFLALCSSLLISCGKIPSSNGEQNQEETKAVYFVKYCSEGLSGRYDAQYRDESGKTVGLQNIAGSEFERTIGPVEKGFECFFSITLPYSQASVRIEVKKNDEPFLVKKESTFGRVTYTIE